MHIRVYRRVRLTHRPHTVVVNDELVAKVMDRYGLRAKREAIDFALRRVAGDDPYELALRLEGSGWDGDFEALRGHPLEPE
jgi:Arc/MetJ family transcription regulator